MHRSLSTHHVVVDCCVDGRGGTYEIKQRSDRYCSGYRNYGSREKNDQLPTIAAKSATATSTTCTSTTTRVVLQAFLSSKKPT